MPRSRTSEEPNRKRRPYSTPHKLKKGSFLFGALWHLSKDVQLTVLAGVLSAYGGRETSSGGVRDDELVRRAKAEAAVARPRGPQNAERVEVQSQDANV